MNLRAIIQKISTFLSKNEKQITAAGAGVLVGVILAEVVRNSIDKSMDACRDSAPLIYTFAAMGAGTVLVAYNGYLVAYNGYKAVQRKLHSHSTPDSNGLRSRNKL